MFRPPSLLSPQIVPTAAILPQGSRGFYVRAYRALLPPHAPDMLTVRKQVIDGTGTFSLSDSQPCRLLTLLHRLSPASTLLRRDPTSAWPSAGRRCLLPAYRSHPSLTRDGVPFADPCRPPRVRTLDVLPLPAPIPLRSRLDFGRRVPWHAHPIGPACAGLHLRSVLQRASGFFPTRPRGARPDCLATPPPACSCLRLAVASNLLRRGLAPPIQGPCLAHQGCSLRSHRLRRLKPLTLTLSPAVHSAMSSMLHCCTSDLKRRLIFLCAFTKLADQIRYQFHSRVPFLHALSLLATRLAGVHVGAMRTLDLLRTSASRPVFTIAGSADGLIPVSMPLALSQAACEPNELWLVEGADHGNVRDTAGPANFDERLSMFLNKALFGGDVD